MHPVVETRSGRLRGSSAGGACIFRGIPYAGPTGGERRFLPAAPVTPWAGLRDALAYGDRAPQDLDPSSGLPWREWIRDRQPMSEDCLVLNVYTPAEFTAGRRPVLCYIHGGGFNTGSGSVPGVDGSILAARGDVVVVTLNHRLNVLGHLWLGDCADARFGQSGNQGMLDIVTALEWIRDNIAGFGGDPGNVTIFGQSGGASKVAVLMTLPAARGLFHKAVIQSASSLIRMATPGEAARGTAALCRELGLDRPDPQRLQAIPVADLHAARRRVVAASGDPFRPVVDGTTLPAHPFEPGAPAAGADIPLLIGTCADELGFTLAAKAENFAITAAAARARVARFMALDEARVGDLLRDYASRRPGATPYQLMVAVMSEHMYRRNDILAAERKAAQGRAPVWMYLFTWKCPAVDGLLGTPHTMCIPFVFGTVGAARAMLGDGPEPQALSAQVMDAWLAFARQGNPGHAGLPAWPAFDAAQRATMIFDRPCRLEYDPLPADRLAIAACPPYSADASLRR